METVTQAMALCGIVHFSLAQHTTPTAGIQEPLVFMKGIKIAQMEGSHQNKSLRHLSHGS